MTIMEINVDDRIIFVDDADAPIILQHKWHLTSDGHVATFLVKNGKYNTARMHKVLLNPPKKSAVYHKNRNLLDCRRENLIVVSTSEIQRLHRKEREKTSEWK